MQSRTEEATEVPVLSLAHWEREPVQCGGGTPWMVCSRQHQSLGGATGV
jgi:hypothetical protein